MDDRSMMEDILRRLEAIERHLHHESSYGHEHVRDHDHLGHGRRHGRCRCGAGCGCEGWGRGYHDRMGHGGGGGHHARSGGWDTDRDRGDGFNEKRVVDLIVSLVAERVEEVVGRLMEQRGGASRPPGTGSGTGG